MNVFGNVRHVASKAKNHQQNTVDGWGGRVINVTRIYIFLLALILCNLQPSDFPQLRVVCVLPVIAFLVASVSTP